MATNNKFYVLDFFTRILSNQGFQFKKSVNIWSKKNNDVWNLINFQKSSWGDIFYLNFGLFFEKIDKPYKLPPSMKEWHFEARYESIMLLSNDQHLMLFSLDVDQTMLDRNLKIIEDVLLTRILPLMNEMNDYKFILAKAEREGSIEGFHMLRYKMEYYLNSFKSLIGEEK